MTSPQIKIFISLAAIFGIFAFISGIRLSTKAGNIMKWLQKERPELLSS